VVEKLKVNEFFDSTYLRIYVKSYVPMNLCGSIYHIGTTGK